MTPSSACCSCFSNLRIRLLAVLFLAALPARADVPVPPRFLDPASAEEAWNIIRLSTENVGRLIRERRALEIADQIMLCSPALRVLARSAVPAEHAAMLDEQTTAAFGLVNLITQNSSIENIAAMPSIFGQLGVVLGELARAFDPQVVTGEMYHCPDHAETVAKEPGSICETCRRQLVPRRLPYSFIHCRAEEPSLKVTLEPSSALTAGKEARLNLTLRDLDGSPVSNSDLWPMHTEPAAVLITGPEWSGFQHLSVWPKDEPGAFAADFEPTQPGKHQICIVLTPYATGQPEIHRFDVNVGGEPEAKPAPSGRLNPYRSIRDGLHLHLSVGGTKGRQLRAGEMQLLQLQVLDDQGKAVSNLEPFRNAFAHFTGFHTGSDTVLQLHPTGGDILDANARGGPTLEFKIFSPEAGTLRLFCEVRIGGKTTVGAFEVQVGD